MKVVRTIALIVVAVTLVGASALVASCGGHVPKSSNIIDGSIAVARDNYYHVSLSVDMSRMRDVTVSGSFTVYGGSGNDIEELILNDVSSRNWINVDTVADLCHSGRVTTDTFDVPITTSGAYHLVYSNKFSIISTKTVATTIDVKWSE